MNEVKKRNGLSSDFIPGKRNHEFTDEDIQRVVKYMDIRGYCLQKMDNTKDYRKEHWTLSKCMTCEEENMRVYMQGIFDACEDVLGWMEGRIDNE